MTITADAQAASRNMDAPTKPSVLFVDDEENVLRGLNRLLRSQRSKWDMRFASSGKQALEMMAQSPADVVVSDMRMPGMDGSELLGQIQKSHPKSIRIVLSGYAERESILKTIGPSHRYLAKPIAEDVLISTIENALKLRQYIHKDSVQETVAGLTHLPILPKVYTEILAELMAEHGSADHLADKIKHDVGISVQLMKLTNSAYFNLPQKCNTVKQAINFLGFENVRAAVLLAGVFEQFKHLSPAMLKDIERLTHRSLAIGVLAQAIARHEGASAETADQAFCAGLLSHVGTLLLIAHNSTAFTASMTSADSSGRSFLDMEEQTFGANHAQLGAYLLGLWGFNDVIVEAVAFHHRPSAYANSSADVLTIVHIAQHLARKSGGSNDRKGSDDGLDEDYLRFVGLHEHIPQWEEIMNTVSKDWPHE